jgi:hypothetical protein
MFSMLWVLLGQPFVFKNNSKNPELEGSFDSEKYFKNQNKRFLNAENIREPKRGYETRKIMKL